MNKQQGFTLIELMIVVAIIGVLSAIAVPAYKNYVTKSEIASAMATMKALITPAELEMQTNNNLNNGLSGLGISSTANSLGEIKLANKDKSSASMTFKFTSGSLVNTGISLSRSNTGWKCTHNTGIDTEACSKGEFTAGTQE